MIELVRRLAEHLRLTSPTPARLDCGDPPGNVRLDCLWCRYTCCPRHRDDPHDCERRQAEQQGSAAAGSR